MARKRSTAPVEQEQAQDAESTAPVEQEQAQSPLAGSYTIEPGQINIKVIPDSLPDGVRFRARVFGKSGGHYMVCDFTDRVAIVPAPPGTEMVVFVKEVDAANAQGEWVKLGEVTTIARKSGGLSKPPSR